MRIHNNKYVCEHVYEGGKDGKILEYQNLPPKEQNEIRGCSPSVQSIENRPYLKAIYVADDVIGIIKPGMGFVPKEHKKVEDHFKAMGYIYFPNISMAHGGGQGATGSGKMLFSKRNLWNEILTSLNILDEFNNIPVSKQLSRFKGILGDFSDLPAGTTVEVLDTDVLAHADGKFHRMSEYEGVIFAKPKWMEDHGIPVGIKTRIATKGLMFPCPDWLHFKADVGVPVDELKIPVYDPEKLAKILKLVWSITPEKRYSPNLRKHFNNEEFGRNPRRGFDLQSLFGMVPHSDFAEIKAVLAGGPLSDELTDRLFGYKARNGVRTLSPVGLMIKSGISIYSPLVYNKALAAITKMVIKDLQGTIKGEYGVAAPLELLPANVEIKHGWITRFPWVLPVKSEYAVWEHLIWLPVRLMKVFGGDFDGDLVCAFARHTVRTPFKYPRDIMKLEEIMAMPEKEDHKTEMNLADMVRFQITQYQGCGRVYNNAKVVVEAARLSGWHRKELIELDAVLYATRVQPYINGFKYTGGDSKVPTPNELAKEFKVPDDFIERAKFFFGLVRSRITSMESIIAGAPAADDNSLSYYEKLLSMFKGWKMCSQQQIQAISPVVESAIKYSYRAFGNNLELRYNYIVKFIVSEEARLAIVANCFKRTDIAMGMFVSTHQLPETAGKPAEKDTCADYDDVAK